MYNQLMGILASILTAISMLPQLIKMVKEKNAENVSILMLFVLLTGLGLWMYYGILIKDWIIIISNGFSVLLNVILLIYTMKYKK